MRAGRAPLELHGGNKKGHLRLLHKASAGGVIGRGVVAAVVCALGSRDARVLLLGGRWDQCPAPELEQVVGGGDQLPLGLAGA